MLLKAIFRYIELREVIDLIINRGNGGKFASMPWVITAVLVNCLALMNKSSIMVFSKASAARGAQSSILEEYVRTLFCTVFPTSNIAHSRRQSLNQGEKKSPRS